MNKSKLFLCFAVLFSGMNCACTQPKTEAERIVNQSERGITFSVASNKVGERYVTTSIIELIVDGDPSTKTTLGATEKHELLKIENGFYTWKTITSFKPQKTGANVGFSADAGFRENRITLTTYNEYGNLVSEEGTEPGEEAFYKSVPETPVKIGDSWEGYSTVDGKDRETVHYTLEAVESIDGAECAVVAQKSTRNKLSVASKSWIGLSTGITYKLEGTMKGLNNVGQKVEGKFSSAVVSH